MNTNMIKANQELSTLKSRVGKAYRGSDGTIRWITMLSARRNYSLMWLDETSGVWHFGGTLDAYQFAQIDGVICACPQPGEKYRKMGATGQIVTARA